MTLRDRLAELEHQQWSHWTSYMLDNLNPENPERWRIQLNTPYIMLSSKEKEGDIEWADKILKILDKLEIDYHDK
jgi:hypothetical protein